MDILRSGIPVTPGVLSQLIGLRSTRPDHGFFRKQVTDATRIRFLTAGSIMSSRGLDCLPTRKGTKQLAHHRGFTHARSEPTHAYDKGTHIPMPLSLAPLLGCSRCGDLQNSPRIFVKVVLHFLQWLATVVLYPQGKHLVISMTLNSSR